MRIRDAGESTLQNVEDNHLWLVILLEGAKQGLFRSIINPGLVLGVTKLGDAWNSRIELAACSELH